MTRSWKATARAIAVLLTAGLGAVVCVGPAWSQGKSAMVSIQGNTPPSLQDATLLSHSDPNAVLDIVVGLRMQNENELNDLIARQSDPNSPDFHNFITPADFARRFAPNQADVDKVAKHLTSHGLTVSQVTPNRMLIEARGTVSQIEQAFSVNINKYNLKEEEHFSNDRDPSVPASLQGAIQSVIGMNSIEKVHGHAQLPLSQAAQILYTPRQIATAYDFPNFNNTYHSETTYTGHGATLAIATACTYDSVDVDYFWRYFGVDRTGTVTNISVNGGSSQAGFETTLDLEAAGIQAPGANILVYSVPGTSCGGRGSFTDADGALMFSQIVNDNIASIVSHSFGNCEQLFPTALMQTIHATFEQGAAQGMAFFAASGDFGAYDCSPTSTTLAVDYPSSDPFVTAVGGTSLFLRHKGLRASEAAWLGSGGGVSQVFRRPFWQVGPGVPHSANRETADVAFDADPSTGSYLFFQGQWYDSSGTSFAAPNWAALWTLATEAVADRIGFATPILYRLGPDRRIFHDITVGSNGNGNGPGFSATRHWDYPTGWGTPNGANLVNSLRDFEDLGRFEHED